MSPWISIERTVAEAMHSRWPRGGRQTLRVVDGWQLLGRQYALAISDSACLAFLITNGACSSNRQNLLPFPRLAS